MNILLIDDHALFREGLSLILKQLEDQVTVVEAENSAQALSQVKTVQEQNSDLDLILLDLHLPDTQGFDLLKEIRSKLPATPVAMLSADENATQISSALNLGATGFITKSSNSQVMLSAVQLILSGGVYVPPAILAGNEGVNVPTPATVEENAGDQTAKDSDTESVEIQFTDRQQQVLNLMGDGLSNKEIAKKLEMSPSTVKVHVAAILRLCDASNRTQAVAFAKNNGLIN